LGFVAGPLVSGDELAALVDDPSVVVCDVRWYLDGRSGRDAYEAGHVPGAVFVDLDTVLAAPASVGEGRHPLPDPGVFAGALGRLGIPASAFVVAYDDAGGAIAARLWWMLRAVGQSDAAVLDGGLAAWPGPLEGGPGASRTTVGREPVPWPRSRIVDADEVAAISEGRAAGVLVDARAAARYAGEIEPVDARAGHIPGAVNVPTSSMIDPDTKRFLPPAELRARFEDEVSANEGGVVAYCGSGVTACHTLLALEVAGLGEGRLFPGSWSAWSARSDRPIASGNDSR
jgi:thiosulfate/3-mercaptopyruvate sulfurtransferase